MDIDLARVLFANFGLYYATFDSDDDMVSIDGKLLSFFRQESSPGRLNLYDLLPELIGMEDVISQAKSGALSAYTLYELMRSPGDDIYFQHTHIPEQRQRRAPACNRRGHHQAVRIQTVDAADQKRGHSPQAGAHH